MISDGVSGSSGCGFWVKVGEKVRREESKRRISFKVEAMVIFQELKPSLVLNNTNSNHMFLTYVFLCSLVITCICLLFSLFFFLYMSNSVRVKV